MACWLTGLLVALVRAQIDPRFKPSMHIFYGSGTINVFDGLPKVRPVAVAQRCPCGTCAHVRPCLSVFRAWLCVHVLQYETMPAALGGDDKQLPEDHH